MVRDLEKNRTQEEGDPLVAKLRARLKEKEKALEVCICSFIIFCIHIEIQKYLKVQYVSDFSF